MKLVLGLLIIAIILVVFIKLIISLFTEDKPSKNADKYDKIDPKDVGL